MYVYKCLIVKVLHMATFYIYKNINGILYLSYCTADDAGRMNSQADAKPKTYIFSCTYMYAWMYIRSTYCHAYKYEYIHIWFYVVSKNRQQFRR